MPSSILPKKLSGPPFNPKKSAERFKRKKMSEVEKEEENGQRRWLEPVLYRIKRKKLGGDDDEMFDRENEGIMSNETLTKPSEEVYVTWITAGLVVAVLGVQFSARPNVKPKNRKIADAICLILAMMMLIWQTAIFYIPAPAYMLVVGNIVFIFLICLLFAVLILGTAHDEFG